MLNRAIIIAITCVVVGQDKVKTGFKTECLGQEVNGYVVLDKKIVVGKAVDYRPYIRQDDDDINGEILGVRDADPIPPKIDEDSLHGKQPH